MMDLHVELHTAILLARKAGASLRRHQCSGIQAQTKAGGELVTAADIEANCMILTGLRAAFPHDAIFSEETPDSPERLLNRRVWIVDPLDSTSNFLAQGDAYCISIGLSIERHAALGVVYNPARDQLFAGYAGDGVTLNGKRVFLSHASRIAGARISVSRKEWQAGLQGSEARARISHHRRGDREATPPERQPSGIADCKSQMANSQHLKSVICNFSRGEDLMRSSDLASRSTESAFFSSMGEKYDLEPLTPVASMAYKLARVAAGLDDATFSLKRRKEWGTCAGAALIAAAGGRATCLDGSELSFNRSPGEQPLGIVAAGPELHRRLLAVLRPSAAHEEVICRHEEV